MTIGWNNAFIYGVSNYEIWHSGLLNSILHVRHVVEVVVLAYSDVKGGGTRRQVRAGHVLNLAPNKAV